MISGVALQLAFEEGAKIVGKHIESGLKEIAKAIAEKDDDKTDGTPSN
jgi:hypothetical protein